MDINEKLLKLEEMNTALAEAILNDDYETQYALLEECSEMEVADGQ